MGAVILLPGVLRPEAADASRLEVSAPGTVRDVLTEVAERWPRLSKRLRDERGELRRYVNLYVDGEECRRVKGLDTPVPDGAEIQIIPSVAGG
ncbi:ubiquitin-like small modifier protein 1 [Catenuloplanes atrovinosus]|uniref:Molybdopterin converting factor small subunit n=1 Tax=Catenuloplanes atrovinosus TaxID=137266 RepID=A0AAE4CGX2_9ACTN|nr:ubiquitin-like small modifier protein 1 [Catenuloplanes atrovinosus]MDR7281175.1 molybdopterin converting factor small subunit [Catenuloplanes atrovinosus]